MRAASSRLLAGLHWLTSIDMAFGVCRNCLKRPKLTFEGLVVDVFVGRTLSELRCSASCDFCNQLLTHLVMISVLKRTSMTSLPWNLIPIFFFFPSVSVCPCACVPGEGGSASVQVFVRRSQEGRVPLMERGIWRSLFFCSCRVIRLPLCRRRLWITAWPFGGSAMTSFCRCPFRPVHITRVKSKKKERERRALTKRWLRLSDVGINGLSFIRSFFSPCILYYSSNV